MPQNRKPESPSFYTVPEMLPPAPKPTLERAKAQGLHEGSILIYRIDDDT
jgi:hypothetical protein